MRVRPLPLKLAGLGALLVLGGCATLEYGSDDAVSVVTDPPGAVVSSSSGMICISPCRVVGPRKDAFAITISKPGFTPQTVVSDSQPIAKAAEATRNEVSADYLGRFIDAQDGSLRQHVPAAFVVKLEPAP